MKTHLVPVRLTDPELQALDRLRSRESTGGLNRSEFIRLLLTRESIKSHRENRKPTGRDYATAFRNGRPANPKT